MQYWTFRRDVLGCACFRKKRKASPPVGFYIEADIVFSFANETSEMLPPSFSLALRQFWQCIRLSEANRRAGT